MVPARGRVRPRKVRTLQGDDTGVTPPGAHWHCAEMQRKESRGENPLQPLLNAGKW